MDRSLDQRSTELPRMLGALEQLVLRQVDSSPVAPHRDEILGSIKAFGEHKDENAFGVHVAGLKNVLSLEMGRNPHDRGLEAVVSLLRNIQDRVQAITNPFDY